MVQLVDVQVAPSLGYPDRRRRDLDEAEPTTSCVDERATHGSERGLHERQLLLAKPPGRLCGGVAAGSRLVAGAEMLAARVFGTRGRDPRVQLAVVVSLAVERQLPVA